MADDPQNLLRESRVRHDVDAADECLARGRDDPGGEDADGCRLACTVRPEEAEDLASADSEIEFVDRPKVRALIDLGQIHGSDDVVGSAHRLGQWGSGSIGHGSVQVSATAESRRPPEGISRRTPQRNGG